MQLWVESMLDYSQRFNKRASTYSQYRPGYPHDILDVLKTETGFDQNTIVADIGSGTGILSTLFLQNGNTVYGVEPNDEMRSLAEQNLTTSSRFVSVRGTAENTTLQDSIIDLITVGQALHWFNREAATREFARILKKTGHVCVTYNDRNKEDSFMQGYEAIIAKHERDRATVPEVDDNYLSRFFWDGIYKKYTLPNEQFLDLEGLLGRITSASYMPNTEDGEKLNLLKDDVSRLFKAGEKAGKVRLLCDTTIFLGQIERNPVRPH